MEVGEKVLWFKKSLKVMHTLSLFEIVTVRINILKTPRNPSVEQPSD